MSGINFPFSLYIFSAHSNKFYGNLTTSLANCTRLTLLDLRKNQLIGELPHYLANFEKLRVLSLGYNNLHGRILQWIANLTKLQVLDLSNNDFSGNIPFSLNKKEGFRINGSSQINVDTLYKLDLGISIKGFEYTLQYVIATNTIIELSNNNLTREIPASIGKLSCLHLLNLSRNHLEGWIPTSLSHISTLEQLGLSRNNLSEAIPQELSKLSMLEVIYVSSNSLCGPIPTGTQFFTFNITSFQKNKSLWGCPLDPFNEIKDH